VKLLTDKMINRQTNAP